MTFNSIEFVLFLLLVLGLHWAVRPRHRNVVVLAASYAFYAWWDPRLVGLLVLSTAVDFVVASRLGRRNATGTTGPQPAAALRRRRLLLGISLATNLGVLGVFKYAGFFVDSLAAAITSLGLQANPPLLDIILPIGISFYTFQTLAYTIDVYRDRVDPVSNVVVFATYVAYFPQLVAGPIERAQRLLPQLTDLTRRPPTGDGLRQALSLIAFGLVKKVVLADGVAPIVNDAFSDPGSLSWLALAAGVLGFAIQIYGDFAGYSSIARGVSLLFGIELMTNFREPYLSRNITEFWQRWHISLSTWLRDYLYIPLGGSRGSKLVTTRNLMLTMLLGGLWHGAAWTFVVWGGLHGLFLVLHRPLANRRAGDDKAADPIPRAADVPRILLTFGLVALTWTFFRASSLAEATAVLSGLLTAQPGATNPADILTVATLGAATLLLDLVQRRQAADPSTPLVIGPVRTGLVSAGLVLALLVFSGGVPEPFIYFQF